MVFDNIIRTVWVVTEDLAGTRNQCLAVSKELGITPDVVTVELAQPWKSLSPYFGFESRASFKNDFPSGKPDVVIAAGRKAIAAARYIKKQWPGTFICFLQDPKTHYMDFDLVATPYHDQKTGNKIIQTDGAPTLINSDLLQKAGMEWQETFQDLEEPRLALLIGGNSKTHKVDEHFIDRLIKDLTDLRRIYQCSYMVTASRRTPKNQIDKLEQYCRQKGDYFWDGLSSNPYQGMLSEAEAIVVTADSASMISDAGSSGKPVYLYPVRKKRPGKPSRLDLLHAHMVKLGIAKWFNGTLEHWTYAPLTDARKVADAIKERLNDR